MSLLAIRLRPEHPSADEPIDQLQELPTAWLETLAQPPDPRFNPGEQVAGRYRVEQLLGRGGMGDVYEAWDEELEIPVALKALHLTGTDKALQRLKLESLLARSVSHPNVCRVYDLSRHDDGGSITWFLTMEMLRGDTLADRLRAQGRFSLETALPLAQQMAAALGAAHLAGVVHRDFKPSNVMLVGEGGREHAVVTDFGIARADAAAVQTLAQGDEPQLAGTPAYMAPEQLRGGEVGPLADIYALGLVLYEMVTARLPFAGSSVIETARRRLEEEAPSPRTFIPELDERWEAVVLRCLAREPSQRFQRAEQVSEALLGGRSLLPEVETPESTSQELHTLPPERDFFVGREIAIEELKGRLSGPAHLVTLLGAGGMGKTRLAVRYAWQDRGAWPGGVWFCDLTEARDVSGIASATARPLGVQLGRSDPIALLGHAIAGRGRCLMILDNFEQVADHAQATVGRWMERAKEARFLVTSRERLGLDEEEVQGVEPLSIEQGTRLFEARAQWLRPGLELVGSEAEFVREIVRLVDGMPLAIELAAARMRAMSAAQIATQMRKPFQLLTGGRGIRHATLEAAIDGSWDMLSEWEKAAWAQCAVFEGGFTLEAAEAVVDLTAWPEVMWVVDVIQSLVDKSLLHTSVPAMAPGRGLIEARFGMYVSLQEYARAKLRERAEAAGAEERHGAWYGHLGTEEALQMLDRQGVARWWQLERELDNLAAACRSAVRRGDGRTVASTYAALWRVLVIRGPFSRAVELGQQALRDAQYERQEALNIVRTLGQAESFSGRMEEAHTHLAAALVSARELGDRRMESIVLWHLGVMYSLQSRSEEARDYLEMALSLARASGNRDGEGSTHNNLGVVYRDLGRKEEARAHFEAALSIVRALGNRRVEGTVLGNLGLLDHDRGSLEEARNHYEAALAIHREVGNRRFEGNILGNLGSLDITQGRMEDADAHLNAALAIHRDMGDRRSEGIALTNLGSWHTAKEQLAEGLADYEAALAIHRELGNQRFEVEVLINLADLLRQQNRTVEAWEALNKGESILRQLDGPVERCKILCIRAELEHEGGNAAAARTTLDAIEALAMQIGHGPDSDLGRMVAHIRHKLN
jgi:predicted ATPase/Tfp pilus assembly protein PilF